MTAARTPSDTQATPRGKAIDRPRPNRLRVVSPPLRATQRRLVHVAVLLLWLLIATAVGLQARQVGGQEHLDDVRTRIHAATTKQVELRAAVAQAESPAKVLEAAEALGMIEPAAVVAVPAPSPAPTVNPG